MPNRTVVVRLGVDSSAAVAGLKKVAAEAKGVAAKVKNEMASTSSSVMKIGSSTSRLGGLFSKAGRDAGEKLGEGITRGADGKLRDAQGKFVNQGKKLGDGLAGGLSGGFKKIGIAGAAGFAAAGAGAIGLGVGLGKAVSKAANFEDSMRQVGKQAGLSGDQLKGMTDLALEMGAKTSFSAQGASDAMLELAKGGLTAAEIRAGALEQTLTLATAGGLELGAAAGYMTQGLNTFNLEASDSGRVAAALAGGANASTASVEDLGTALSQVGPSAAQLGLSIEDTTGALAAFTNNGIKGSDAGTSLKTMLTRLQPTTLETQRLFDELGLTTEEAGNRFFDAEGNLKSMSDVAGILQEALRGQTREQKAATLETLFGADAQRAATILAKEGASGIGEYVKATSDSAAAQELAQSATEGYSGALERFKGSIETAQIQLGRKFLPILTTVLDYLSGPGISTFQSIAGILRDTFAPQIDNAAGGIERFFEYLSTHQADVIRTFQSWGNGVFDFGIAVAKMTAGGLRNIGDFAVKGTNAVLDMVEFIIGAFNQIPGVNLDESVENFKNTRREAERMATGVREDLYGVASDIDTRVVPSVRGMKNRFNEASNQQIIKAEQRDQVAKIDTAIKGLSKSVEGNTRTTKDNSTSLDVHTARGRTNRTAILNAAEAMDEKAVADFEATRKSKGLKVATEEASERLRTNRQRLRDAAIAAGFNKTEVDKLIGKTGTLSGKFKGLDTSINNLNGKSVTVNTKIKFSPDKLAKTIISGDYFNTPSAFQARGGQVHGGGLVTHMPGQRVQYKAGGGKVQNFSGKGRRSYDTEPAMLRVDEHVWTPEEVDAAGGHKAMFAMRKAALKGELPVLGEVGYANGGRVNFDFRSSRLPKRSLNAMIDQVARESGRAGVKYTEAEASDFAKAALKKVKEEGAAGGGPNGGGGGAVGSGRRAIYNAMVRLGGSPVFTYPGHQPSQNKAWDAMIQNMREGDLIAGHLKANAKKYGVQYLIWNRRIWNIQRNAEGWRRYFDGGSSNPNRAHTNHVHVSHYKAGGTVKKPLAEQYIKPIKYDQGGIMKPGLGLHYNGTRKPEHVVTDARWQQLINSRSAPARIDSADMDRLVDALAQRVPAQLTIMNPVAEPASRSIATAALYASR